MSPEGFEMLTPPATLVVLTQLPNSLALSLNGSELYEHEHANIYIVLFYIILPHVLTLPSSGLLGILSKRK